MMDNYSLTRRQARTCRVAGTAFLILGTLSALLILLSAFTPELSARCRPPGCQWEDRPIELVPDSERAAVEASPAARQAFEDYVAQPLVRLALVGIRMIGRGPFALLLLCVGLALRRLGARSGDPLARALPWLRRGSLAAIVWAIAVPIADSLMEMLMYRGTPAGPHWVFSLNLVEMGTALMLAIAAYATVWALEAGLRAKRELDDFV